MTAQLFVCPKCGQASTEPDFCSGCGARIETTTFAAPVAGIAEVCPTCGTPRPSAAARFCEVCRYDFLKRMAGEPPVVQPAAPDPVVAGTKWDVLISVDPTLDVESDDGLQPPNEPERHIPLDRPENLVGRRDATQPIVPDVSPHDPSVSRRHAKLLVHADGSIAILDLESANGTFVNGEQILAGVERQLSPSDVVTMGRWTRLRVEPRALD